MEKERNVSTAVNPPNAQHMSLYRPHFKPTSPKIDNICHTLGSYITLGRIQYRRGSPSTVHKIPACGNSIYSMSYRFASCFKSVTGASTSTLRFHRTKATVTNRIAWQSKRLYTKPTDSRRCDIHHTFPLPTRAPHHNPYHNPTLWVIPIRIQSSARQSNRRITCGRYRSGSWAAQQWSRTTR